MSNTTVYPFGTGGSLPASIGIVNDMTTGGADKALSAEQGKIIGGKIDVYDDMVDDLYGVEAEVDVYPGWFHAYDIFFPTKKIVREAIAHFDEHVKYAMEHYFAPQSED